MFLPLRKLPIAIEARLSRTLTDLGEFTSRHGWRLALWTSLATLLGLQLFVELIPKPPPYILIEAEAESFRYTVRSPAIAEVVLVNAAWRPPDSLDEIDLSGVFAPAQDTEVRYLWSPERISIVAEGATRGASGEAPSAGLVRRSHGPAAKLGPRATFTMAREEMSGLSPASRPLPIAGPATIGIEQMMAVEPSPGARRSLNLLLGGEIQIFGREALPCGLIRFWWCSERGSLYVVDTNDGIPLPTGGRLEGVIAAEPKYEPLVEPASWYGTVRVGGKGLEISAATSTNLRLYRPGLGADYETFDIGLLARLFDDPSVAAISLPILITGFAFQALCALAGASGRRP